MEFNNIKEQVILLDSLREVEKIKAFLKRNNLNLDDDIEYTVALYDGEDMIGTGSFSGNVLKCIAVEDKYKGLGISSRIVSLLIEEEYRRGKTHLFIFTKPSNYLMFYDMGFYKIAEVKSEVVLLENKKNGIMKYIEDISKYKSKQKNVASIVMNCNPFTLGHKYLIEKASKECDTLHVFLVWEDKSSFPVDVRYNLVKAGTKHLSNVYIHKGENYIISNATFPSYFIKEDSKIVKAHALLDLQIFGQYIAPELNIIKRYVGEEPYCPVTKIYNKTMKEILPNYNIEVLEIPRLDVDGSIISASKVRNLLKEGEIEKVKKFVPKTTYDYLVSKDAEAVITNIRQEYKRH